ncbi:hypothetical protein COCVIDRAFT_89766, partial [Bipolaris victoriae FI3]
LSRLSTARLHTHLRYRDHDGGKFPGICSAISSDCSSVLPHGRNNLHSRAAAVAQYP